jgi:tRNA (guanosine-2'-O-)-methyltransferase
VIGREKRIERLRSIALTRQPDIAVCMENVQDFQNFGAILRSCDATGVMQAYALQHREDLIHVDFILGKRSSMGTRKWVSCHVYNDMQQCVNAMKEKYIRILGAIPGEGSVSLFDLDLTQPFVLVFGNEREGLSDEFTKHCSETFYIPQSGMIDSLNLSVACGVALYEAYRQRTLKGMYDENYEAFLEDRQAIVKQYEILGHTKAYPRVLKHS